MDIPKHDIPASLLAVQDLIDRLPAERERLLRHEIHWREREQLQSRGIRRLMHGHAWVSFRTVFAIGLSVFVFVFTLGQFAGLARWVQQLQTTTLEIPKTVQRTLGLSLDSLVPTSTVVEYAAQLPPIGLVESGLVALLVVIALLAWKGYNTYFLLLQAHELRREQKSLQEEIDILMTWIADIDKTDKKK